MSLSYSNTIPDPTHKPVNDVNPMQTNFASIQTLVDVDHFDFANANYGKHKEVTLGNVAAPGAQTDPQSVLYTRAGTAAAISDLAFKNQNGTFQVSPIRAWGAFDATGTAIGGQSVNVSGIVHNSTGVYTVTLTANATTGTSFGVQCTPTRGGLTIMAANYNITGANTFVLRFLSIPAGVVFDPDFFTLSVFQL